MDYTGGVPRPGGPLLGAAKLPNIRLPAAGHASAIRAWLTGLSFFSIAEIWATALSYSGLQPVSDKFVRQSSRTSWTITAITPHHLIRH